MRQEIREKILRDYKIVNDFISKVLSENSNHFVESKHYIFPDLSKLQVPMNDSRGEFVYLKRMRQHLETILTKEKIYTKIPNAPAYIERFFTS